MRPLACDEGAGQYGSDRELVDNGLEAPLSIFQTATLSISSCLDVVRATKT